MKKLLKSTLYCVCTLLVFATVLGVGALVIEASYGADVPAGNEALYSMPTKVGAIKADADNVPLDASAFGDPLPSVGADAQDEAVKNLLSFNALVNGTKVPVTVVPPKQEENDDDKDDTDDKDDYQNGTQYGYTTLTREYAVLKQPDGSEFIYYEQTWDEYDEYPYGDETIGGYGCGPTSMAMVVSSLTGDMVGPKEMCGWCEDKGYFVSGRGTAHAMFSSAAKKYGIDYDTIDSDDEDAVLEALKEGKFLITVVGNGVFSPGRHFLLLRGITADGKILVGDSGKFENCLVEWDFDGVMEQVALERFYVFG